MVINNEEVDIDKLLEEQKTSFLKRRENGLMLSDDDIAILKRNGLNYQDYNNLKSLLFAIESLLDENEDEELEELSIRIGECNYYNYTNK